jgi:hypothetical protein
VQRKRWYEFCPNRKFEFKKSSIIYGQFLIKALAKVGLNFVLVAWMKVNKC